MTSCGRGLAEAPTAAAASQLLRPNWSSCRTAGAGLASSAAVADDDMDDDDDDDKVDDSNQAPYCRR